MDRLYQRIKIQMQKKGYPVSVQETAIGTIMWSNDQKATAIEVQNLLNQDLTAQEMVRALQPIIKKG